MPLKFYVPDNRQTGRLRFYDPNKPKEAEPINSAPVTQQKTIPEYEEPGDKYKYIGKNLIPIKKDDKPLSKFGKELVNYGVGTIGRIFDAPFQAIANTSEAIESAITGKPIVIGEKSFVKDVLPEAAGKKIEGLKESNPIIGTAVEAGLSALADPTTYIGGGIVDDLSKAGIIGKGAKVGTAENLAVSAARGQRAVNAIANKIKSGKLLTKAERDIVNNTPELKALQAQKVGGTETPTIDIVSSIDKKPKNIRDSLSKLYNTTVDNTSYIKKAAGQEGNIATTVARSAGGTVDYSLKNGLVDMEGKKIVDKGIAEIYNLPVDQQIKLDELLFHQHNIDRIKQGKQLLPDNITSKVSQQAINDILKQYPHLKERADYVRKTLDSLLDDWGVKSGLVSPELRDTLRNIYPNYVPGTRKLSGADAISYKSRGMGPAKIINRATGGDEPLITLKESIPSLINKTIKAAKKNEVYKTILDVARKDPSNPYARILEPANKIDAAIEKNVADSMLEAVRADGIEAIAGFGDKALETDQKLGYLLTVMEKGKPVKLQISKELFDSLKALDKVDDTSLHKALQAVKKYGTNPFKSLVTGYNPLFAARNIARDIPTAYIQGTENNPIRFVQNLYDAAKDMATNSPRYQEYLALGGQGGNYFNVERGIKSDKKILKVVGAVNNATETLPRYAEYLGTLKREGDSYASKMKALHNAQEVTTNFGRHGDLTKSLDAGIPYLNPSVQGVDKFFRTMFEFAEIGGKKRIVPKVANIAKAIGTITVPTIGFYALNQVVDKEGYDKLDNRTKDTYFLIPEGNGKFIKIPKTRESGAIFGALFERIARAVQGDNKAFKGFDNTLATNFLPNNPITSNFLYPGIQVLKKEGGKDFAGRDIVPAALKGYSPKYQYDEQTSEIAKKIGSTFNMSPKKIDYLINSYTGIIGDIVQPLTTKSNYSNGKGNIGRIVTSSFTADSLYNNEIQKDFYNNLNEIKTSKNDAKLTGGSYNDNLLSGMNKMSDDIATLRSLIKSVETDPNLTPEEKNKISREYQAQILAIALAGNDMAEKNDSSLEAKFPELRGIYYPNNEFTFNKKKYTLTSKEYEKYRELSHGLFRKGYESIKDSLEKLPGERQETVLQSLIERSNKLAQQQILHK